MNDLDYYKTKLARVEPTPEQEKKDEPIRFNKDVLKAGLKMVGAGALGSALGSGAYHLAGHLIDKNELLRSLEHKQLLQAASALGVATPAVYGMLRWANRDYLRNAYERSKKQPDRPEPEGAGRPPSGT